MQLKEESKFSVGHEEELRVNLSFTESFIETNKQLSKAPRNYISLIFLIPLFPGK